MNVYIVYEINFWTFIVGHDFMQGNPLFRDGKLSANANPDKYKYYGYGTGFDVGGSFFLCDGGEFAL